MTTEQNKYLAVILYSIACIDEFIGRDKQFEQYDNSKLLQAAIERPIEITGEATRHL